MPGQPKLDSSVHVCRFLSTSSARTYDPSGAKLFFIPAFLARLFFNEFYSETAAAVLPAKHPDKKMMAHLGLCVCSKPQDFCASFDGLHTCKSGADHLGSAKCAVLEHDTRRESCHGETLCLKLSQCRTHLASIAACVHENLSESLAADAVNCQLNFNWNAKMSCAEVYAHHHLLENGTSCMV